MLTLLTPIALAGLSLLLIPILVHLFKPRRVRVTPFSSLRWLRHTQHKLSRRVQLHQILLFLLRAAFIALLVLALARPIFSPPGVKAAAERFVVLDVSRSMGYRPAGRPTPIDLGKQVAERLVTEGLGDDRTSVLLVSSTAQTLGPLVRDPELLLPKLRGARLTDADTRLTATLPLIRSMLNQRRPDADVELFFVTDNHQNIWAENDIRDFEDGLTGKVRVRLVDVGVGDAANAWIAGARLLQSREGGGRLVRVQLGAVGPGPQARTLRLGGLTGLPDQTRPVTIEPDKPSRVDFDLPATYSLQGRIARLSLEPADSLASDDEYLLNLDAQGGLNVLVVEGDTTQIEPLRPGFHLKAAVGALATSQSTAVDLISRTPATLTIKDLEQAAVILLADVPELTEDLLTALQNRVRDGAGLGVFVGPSAKPEFYNNRLFNPLSPAESLSPVTVGAPVTIEQMGGRMAGWIDVRWNHPLLAGLHDPVLGDLGATQFQSFRRLEQPPGAVADVLAWFEVPGATPEARQVVPAILDRPFGAGRVLLFNTTANDQWTDLPRRKSFVPLIDRLTDCLAGGGSRRMFEVGEAVTLSVPVMKPDDTVEIVAPDGAMLRPEFRSAGARTLLRLGAVARAGAYAVRRNGQPELTFIVQAGRGDSVLHPTDMAQLRQWWMVADFRALSPAAVLERHGGLQRLNVSPWLVLVGLLTLLAEMYFVHRLCPRMNPRAVQPTTRSRILAPTESPAAETNTPVPGS